jgi:hypothetical protein
VNATSLAVNSLTVNTGGTTVLNGSVTINGNFTVTGSTTTSNTASVASTANVITLNNVVSPGVATDTNSNGGGITLFGTKNKTIAWNAGTLAWDINQSIKEFPNKEEKIQQNRGRVSHAPKIRHETDLLAYAFGIVIGLILSMPSFLADANFRGAVESRKVEQIVNAANRWPQDSVRYDAAYFLLKKEFPVQANEVARTATEKIQNGYPGWKNLYYSANATDLEKQIAKKKLMELDPLTNFDSEISN